MTTAALLAEADAETINAVAAMFPAAQAYPSTPTAAPVDGTANLGKVTAALKRIPADNYDEWVFVGMALKSAFDEATAASTWDWWSRTATNFDESAMKTHWVSFHDRPGGKTIAYIFWLADSYDRSWRNEWDQEAARSPAVAPGSSSTKQERATRRAVSAKDVLDKWQKYGPLRHVPTGIRSFDDRTGGGPVFGTRIYLLGAPDAGKTVLLVQLLDSLLDQGLAVGLLAVDEEPDDVLQRFLQRRGWSRRQCEERRPEDLALMREQIDGLPIQFYDSTWTIEAAAADLAAFAKQRGVQAALGIDSIQTARCIAETQEGSRYEVVSARVQAVRAVAIEHDLITLATSEMSRAAYRAVNSNDRINDMAAAKESGAIEYSARIAISLRSVPDESDLIELRIVKNKHGPSHHASEPGIHLRLNRAAQTLAEDTTFESPSLAGAASAKTAQRDQETNSDAARMAVIIAKTPGVAAKRCEELASGATPGRMGHNRLAAARGRLGDSLIIVPGKGTQKHLYLDGSRVPAEVVVNLSPEDQQHVRAATAPTSPAVSDDPPRPAPTRPEPPQGGSGTSSGRDAPAPLIGGGGASSGAGRESDQLGSIQPGAGRAGAASRTATTSFDDGLPEQPRGGRRKASGQVTTSPEAQQ